MERNVSLDEISDGKLYGNNDMVKADCGSCEGCSACCRGMGSSIQLDPLDLYRILSVSECGFEGLLEKKIELNLVDGIILPNLKMTGENEQCGYLDTEGRCSIHSVRPGFCRLFPLGRYYEDHSFHYFLQRYECRNTNRTKVKVRKWIDTPDIKKYEQFIIDWHYFLKDLQNEVRQSGNPESARKISLYILKEFYMNPYRKEEDFYVQFYERLERAEKVKKS